MGKGHVGESLAGREGARLSCGGRSRQAPSGRRPHFSASARHSRDRRDARRRRDRAHRGGGGRHARAAGSRAIGQPSCRRVEHAGGEGVARAVDAGDGARRQRDRAERDAATRRGRPRPRLRENARRPSASLRARARRQSRARPRSTSVAPSGRRVSTPGERADLEIVDDEQIEMRQAGTPELGEPRGGGRHQFEIGREASALAPCAAPPPSRSPPRPSADPSPHARRAGRDAGSARCVEEKSKWSGVIVGRDALMIEMRAPAAAARR